MLYTIFSYSVWVYIAGDVEEYQLSRFSFPKSKSSWYSDGAQLDDESKAERFNNHKIKVCQDSIREKVGAKIAAEDLTNS